MQNVSTETFAKLFFIISFTGLLIYIILAFYTFHISFKIENHIEKVQYHIQETRTEYNFKDDRYDKDLKYILLWTVEDKTINPVGDGQIPFIVHNCSQINCFMSTNKLLLNKDYSNFDAIIFNTNAIKTWKKINLPQNRSVTQKYVFYSMESSDEAPICNVHSDNFFNWTWSYKLYSDIFNPFYEVRDINGNAVAPSPGVEWDPNPKNLTDDEMEVLKGKTKALAWIMNKCQTRTNRMLFAKRLQAALLEHELSFDIYGCEMMKCPKYGCLNAIEKDYYFYLAFEDSFADDYVTGEVLKAYNHMAVPIVVGGADYTKFLPEDSYIDARYIPTERLAAIIMYSIRNPNIYYNFHRFRKRYTFHPVDEFRGLCELCNLLNNPTRVNTYSSYETFRKWWYLGVLRERCLPKGAENLRHVINYINNTKFVRGA